VQTFPVRVLDELDAALADGIDELLAVARRTDGVAALNEQALLLLRDPSAGVCHLVAESERALLGYALLDRSEDAAARAECVVRPDARGRGIGRALVEQLLARSGSRALEIWSHGDSPAAAAVARHTGLRRVRELRRMRLDLTDPLPAAVLPDGVTLRTFRPDTDAQAWVELNAAAFSGHPEQGAMTLEDLQARMHQPWFDPAGFFLAERDGVPVGFHWTKVHTEPAEVGEQRAVGEVYVIGVHPQAQGGGLGRALTLRGLHHLRDAGLGSVLLYVEADNAAALRVYARLGFAVDAVDAQYRS
jgi:mycothiol synthase